MKLVALLLLLQAILQQSQASTSSARNPVDGIPTNLLVTDTGVLISVLDKLIVLDVSNFSNWRTYDGYDIVGSNISVIAAVGEGVLVCLYNNGRSPQGKCSFQVDYLHCTSQENCIVEDYEVNLSREGSCLTAVNDDIYFASSEDHEFVFGYIQLGGYDTEVRKSITAASFKSRKFIYSIIDDQHIYFVALDSFSSPQVVKEITLIRACHISNMSSVMDFSSMFEITLDCGFLSDNISIVSYLKINRILILGLSDGSNSRLCAFSLEKIDIKIMQAFNSCYTEIYSFQLPWMDRMSTCVRFNEVKLTTYIINLLRTFY